jgi:hypothetical protein
MYIDTKPPGKEPPFLTNNIITKRSKTCRVGNQILKAFKRYRKKAKKGEEKTERREPSSIQST